MTDITINGKTYPLKGWNLISQSEELQEEWTDWAQMGETKRDTRRGYYFSEGFDATTKGVLRLAPHYKNLNNTSLTTGYGHFVEANGSSGTTLNEDTTAGNTTTSDEQIWVPLSYIAFDQDVTAGNANRLLIVAVSAEAGPGFIESVTYGGLECTKLAGRGSGSTIRTVLYYLLDPPTGTHEVKITVDNPLGYTIVAGASVWYGVNQETPFGTVKTNAGTSTSPTLTVSTGAGEWIFYAVGSSTNGTMTAGTNETERWDVQQSTNMSGYGGIQDGDDGDAIAPTLSKSGTWAAVGVSIKPAATTPYVTCADAGNMFEHSYDSDVGLTLTDTQAIASGVPGRPAFFTGKWYAPLANGVNAYRLDSPGTGTRWNDSGYKAAHHSTYQQGNSPTLARGQSSPTNEVDMATAAPTADGSFGDDFNIGDTSTDITDMAEIAGELLISKEDNLYQMNEEGVSKPVLGFRPRGRADADNGKGLSVFTNMAFYPSADGLDRYVINERAKAIGLDTLRGFRDTPEITCPKDWRPAWTVWAGRFLYVLLNSDSETLVCQLRFRGPDDPPGDEMVWNSLLKLPLCKGAFVDSRMNLWLKGASDSEDDRDIRVIELDKNGGLRKPQRRGQVSTIHDIWFDEVDFGKPYDTKQFTEVAVETSNWATGASLQVRVYRDDNSVEDVGTAITSATLTELSWTAGTSDTGRRGRLRLTLTTDATYVPVTSDPQILRVLWKARTPMVYEHQIDASPDALSGYESDPKTALEELRRLVSGPKVTIFDIGRENVTFDGDVVSVQEKWIKDDEYVISVFVQRWDVN